MRIWRVPYPKFGKGPGFERIARIAERLGLDLAGFGSEGAVIVGSNGKGSTAAMTAALLGARAANVGLFTSPHLFRLNERFRVGDEDIPDDELEAHWDRVRAATQDLALTDELGGFEFLFLVAADWFAARGCPHTIWEAGIGGRLDPVRLIEARRAALTSLDLEHTQLLGATLEDIARDKIEAAPEGARLFVGASCAPQRPAIEAHAQARGVSSVFVGEAHHAPLQGEHQRRNAALALALARDMAPGLGEDGLQRTRWPGRLEIIDEAPFTVIDVGHTVEAIEVARSGFERMRGDREAVLVCGASADKDAARIIDALAPAFTRIVCAAARHKGAPAAAIAAHAVNANGRADVAIAESVAEARALARARAGEGGAIYVAGGLFLAAEYKWVNLGRDPGLLAFF